MPEGQTSGCAAHTPGLGVLNHLRHRETGLMSGEVRYRPALLEQPGLATCSSADSGCPGQYSEIRPRIAEWF
jgi:hypothetical protein